MNEAIDFANWIWNEGWSPVKGIVPPDREFPNWSRVIKANPGDPVMIYFITPHEYATTEQLYELFKKQP